MSLYVLDTDHLSLFQRGHPQVVVRVLNASFATLAITIITAEEQIRGRLSQVRKAADAAPRVQAYARLQETLAFMTRVRILHYDEAAETEYQALRRQRIRIGVQDLRIAAIVRTLDYTLVTCNRADFGQVPDLRLENWSLS